jgi:hypothetical protein
MAWRSQEYRTTDSNMDKTVVDRTSELRTWIDYCYPIIKRLLLVRLLNDLLRSDRK